MSCIALAALAFATADAAAARSLASARAENLAEARPVRAGIRDPIARFTDAMHRADFAHREAVQQAHARLESDIDAEIEHRRASGARLSKIELQELADARAMLRSSVTTLLATTEDSWDKARRQAEMTLEAVRIAYFALQPQQLAMR